MCVGRLHVHLDQFGAERGRLPPTLAAAGRTLRSLKGERDKWAHSANSVDLFLMLQQQDSDILLERHAERETILNSRDKNHVEAPNADSLERFEAAAKDAVKLAHRTAIRVAQLYERELGSIPWSEWWVV